jgi:glycosyltransferase involved in cell wall biosynthesis
MPRPTGIVGEQPHAAGLEMRDLLYVAYHFPPQSSSGTHRLLGFARHLPEWGWRPRVVAPRVAPGEPIDDALLSRVPPDCAVTRTGLFDAYGAWSRFRGGRRGAAGPTAPHAARSPGGADGAGGGEPAAGAGSLLRRAVEYASWLPAIPDRRSGWVPFAVRALLAEHAARPAAVLFASGPPWSALVAASIAARLSQLPWVADLRDPWRGAGPFAVPFRSLGALDAGLENAIVRSADRLVFTTEETRALYSRRFPRGASRFRVVTNGVDDDDSPAPSAPESRVFTAMHAGEVYGERRVDALLEAASRAVETGRVPAGALRLRFVGGGTDAIGAALEGSFAGRAVRPLVDLGGPVPHAAALAEMTRANLLLSIGFSAGLQVPGKLFEYLRTGRPILALDAPGGAVERILRRAGGDWRLVPRDDAGAILDALVSAYGDWTSGRSPRALPDIEPFRRRRLAGELAAILDEAAA